MNRRDYLTTSALTGLMISTTGCLNRLPFIGENGNDTNDSNGNENNEDTTNEENTNNNNSGSNDNETYSDDTDDTTETEPSEDEGNEQNEQNEGNEGNEDTESGPSEADTEIDRDQYEDPGEQETEERSTDDIEIEATPEQDEYGGVTVTGSVTNVSDTTIDVVDLEIVFIDTEEEYLSSTLVSLRDLDSGATEEFQASASADQLTGDVGEVEINPSVYDTDTDTA